MAASKALAAWTELNDRQQGTLEVIFRLDQENEAAHRAAAAAGQFDKRPAAAWRAIDFTYVPSGLAGATEMQVRLASRGWHNQGNGSTVKALVARGLITETSKPTVTGELLRVRLTREGRAAARAGLAMPATPKAALSERSWEVLVYLWEAGLRDGHLQWGHSLTIDRVLIGKHVPPLAEPVAPSAENKFKGGYRITDRGRWFYREHHAAHCAAHPAVKAPHPDGTEAEPWPEEADRVLSEHRRLYEALCRQWESACGGRDSAAAELSAAVTVLPGNLPAAVRDQAEARDKLWRDTAKQRAELAGAHAACLEGQAERCARSYAAAALSAYAAAVAGASPGDIPAPDTNVDQWDEPRLAPPAETGIHVIDEQARKLHATAVGVPVPRRGPAPSRRSRRHAVVMPDKPELPGEKMAGLADFLRLQVGGGKLMRRLHPEIATVQAGGRSA